MRDIQLAQKGRSSLDFAGALARLDNALNRKIDARLRDQLEDSDIADDYDQRLKQISEVVAEDPMHMTATLANDWLSRQHGEICRAAFEEVQADYQSSLTALQDGPTTLETRDQFRTPDYFSKQWFHNTSGGWDGHPFMGMIQAEFVHRRYVAAKYGSGLRRLRYDVLDELPIKQYDNILEMGTSAGYFTEQLSERFPDAKITGCDLSRRMLEQAQRLGNEQGRHWRLIQAGAEDTGLPDNSFDLVTSYAMFHEIPSEIAQAVWREAARVAKPGAWIYMVDGVPALDAIDKIAGWRYLFGWLRGGEPYAREYCTANDGSFAAAAGLVDVTEGTFGDRPFPRFTKARKP